MPFRKQHGRVGNAQVMFRISAGACTRMSDQQAWACLSSASTLLYRQLGRHAQRVAYLRLPRPARHLQLGLVLHVHRAQRVGSQPALTDLLWRGHTGMPGSQSCTVHVCADICEVDLLQECREPGQKLSSVGAVSAPELAIDLGDAAGFDATPQQLIHSLSPYRDLHNLFLPLQHSTMLLTESAYDQLAFVLPPAASDVQQ